jgi:signal peptidase I
MKRIITLLVLITTPAVAQDLCICPQCMGSALDRYSIVSQSMEPTLQVGQCVIARMIAADPTPPVPGDLIVFRHPVTSVDHIFRLIAMAGDTVQMVDGALVLNGTPVQTAPMPPYKLLEEFKTEPSLVPQRNEMLPRGASYAVIDLERGDAIGTTPLMTVPSGDVFVLGDNRDNAFDSRFSPDIGGPGFVPTENILGIVVEIRPLP